MVLVSVPGEQAVAHSHSSETYADHSSYEFREPNSEGHVGDHSLLKASCLEDFKSIKVNLEENINHSEEKRADSYPYLPDTALQRSC